MLIPMGRPSKGERDAITAKPSLPLGAIIKRNADELQMSYGDYMVAIAAHALGLPDEAPKPGRSVEALDGMEALLPPEFFAPVVPETVAPITTMHNTKELRTKLAS